MAHMTADGKRKSSKFRANRADREHARDKEERERGPRAEANAMEGKREGNPEHEPPAEHDDERPESPAEEAGEEMIHPDIHEEIKQIAAEHGPAHTIHMLHDHEGMRSHVHSMHADGHEHHADHDGEMHVQHAHEHAMHAAGVGPKEPAEAEPNPDEGQAMPMGPTGGEEGEYPL